MTSIDSKADFVALLGELQIPQAVRSWMQDQGFETISDLTLLMVMPCLQNSRTSVDRQQCRPSQDNQQCLCLPHTSLSLSRAGVGHAVTDQFPRVLVPSMQAWWPLHLGKSMPLLA